MQPGDEKWINYLGRGWTRVTVKAVRGIVAGITYGEGGELQDCVHVGALKDSPSAAAGLGSSEGGNEETSD